MKELDQYDNHQCIAGGDENTYLKERSVGYITTAQVFHWFNVKLFKEECLRILRPNRWIFLIWNLRDIDTNIPATLVWMTAGGFINFVMGLPIYLSFRKGIIYGVR